MDWISSLLEVSFIVKSMLKQHLFLKKIKEGLLNEDYPISKKDILLHLAKDVTSLTVKDIRRLKKLQLCRIKRYKKMIRRLSKIFPNYIYIWNIKKKESELKEWYGFFDNKADDLKEKIQGSSDEECKSFAEYNKIFTAILKNCDDDEYKMTVCGLINEIDLFLQSKIKIPLKSKNPSSSQNKKISVKIIEGSPVGC